MNRKLLTALSAALLVALLLAGTALADKSYRAERFDVQIDLQADGSALVTETVEFYFEGGDFTYAFRDISVTETDGISFIEAYMDRVPMPPGTQAGQVEVAGGNPLKVTWHFAPTSGPHLFTVRYRAAGVVRKGDADTVIWRAIPEDHDYSIARSTITITYPSQASLLQQPTLSRSYETSSADHTVTLTTGSLGQDEQLLVTASFASGSLTQNTPAWQIRKSEVQAATAQAVPAGLIAGLATLVLGGLALFAYARSDQRDLNLGSVINTASPPADVPPAVVGKLTGKQHNVMAAVFDLAQRGVLEIREQKGFLGARKYILSRKETGLPLQPQEQGLLQALFKPGEADTHLDQIATRLQSHHKLFDEPLEQQLVQRGWLDEDRKQKRNRLFMAGLAAMVFGTFIIFGTICSGAAVGSGEWAAVTGGLAGIGIALFLLSIIILMYAASFSPLTPAGEEQKARWESFARYLKGVSRGEESAIRPDYFERYLAYAVVFGLGTNWAKYFDRLGGVPLPAWFHAMAGSNGDFGAMIAVMSASDSASASAAGGGAGASGGGSSGAG
jgi:uncharacterized protein (TIGR04222 family)